MGGLGFHFWWGASSLALLAFAGWLGRKTRQGTLGILVDGRGRFSLTHFQIVAWTLVILSSLLGVLFAEKFDASKMQLSAELLGLMGISAGSTVLAAGVKGAKDAPGSSARVARAGTFTRTTGATLEVKARLSQVWLEEEGDLADQVVSITKFQNFLFTLVVLAVYISSAWKLGGIPTVPESLVWLIGISHAGYVGGKVPNKG
jgi:hypothetical protein